MYLLLILYRENKSFNVCQLLACLNTLIFIPSLGSYRIIFAYRLLFKFQWHHTWLISSIIQQRTWKDTLSNKEKKKKAKWWSKNKVRWLGILGTSFQVSYYSFKGSSGIFSQSFVRNVLTITYIMHRSTLHKVVTASQTWMKVRLCP